MSMDCTRCKSCNDDHYYKWRFQCVNCRCPNYCHKNYAKVLEDTYHFTVDWTNNIYAECHNQLSDYQSALSMARSNNLVWLPIGVQSDELTDFVEVWNESSEIYLLEKNKSNEWDRTMMILRQIPKVDWASRDKKEISGEDGNYFSIREAFKKKRDLNHLGFGEIEFADPIDVCINCNETFTSADKYCVRITHSATYVSHLKCFKCNTCKERLVDLHYCWNNEDKSIYCFRHFGDANYSRCAGCDELIFSKFYIKGMDQEYHENHFVCQECETSLLTEKYILKNEIPFCVNCFNNKFGNPCERCSEKIGCDDKDLSFSDRHWHDKCFFCDNCQESLVDKTFAVKEKEIYCSNCFDNKFGSRCNGCGEIFKSGTKKYDYADKEWHEQCFLCDECHQTIGNKSFIPKNGKIICITCYESKYSQKCTKCLEIIRKGGVTYKAEPWHKECFLCTNCGKMLANTKFTSKDEKPYCAECFAELFSKRCTKCTKPISGFGGCKFISLEDDNWHTECFTCSECQASLVGKGFMTHNENILCENCGKNVSTISD